MYDTLKAKYSENRIVVIGQSIGSGAASFLSAHNQPKMVILQAPYYSIADWIHQLVPALKIVNNSFKLETYSYLKKITYQLVLIHGDVDDAVYYGSSKKLSRFIKPTDRFITLPGEGHNDFTKNETYLTWIKRLLK